MGTHELDHPLAAHRLAELRATTTGPERFRHLLDELASMLAFEATRQLPTEAVAVDTPLGVADGRRLAGPTPLVVPILRAGLGMLDATIRMVPTSTVALLGMRRDHETLQPSLYADTVPSRIDGATVFLLDPMLATGGSIALACETVLERGASEIFVLSIVAAPEGLAHLSAKAPNVEVWIAAIDPKLDDVGYIRPGLGDAGDRLYGLLDSSAQGFT
jgi:uracil phosphoribosyltransferase